MGILALPAIGILNDVVTSDDARIMHRLLHPTGEFAARFMIIGMMATPLMYLFKGWCAPRWLVKNRRYFGVAAFGYAALHTGFYLGSEPWATVVSDFTKLDIWTGWLAFVIFIPLAATSMDYAARKLGTAWKPLQRWTYVLTLMHWASLHDWRSPWAAVIHFAPLALLTLYRLWYVYLRPRRPTAAAA